MKNALRRDLLNLLIKDGVSPSSAEALLKQLSEPVGLRDTFAASALTGMLSNPSEPPEEAIKVCNGVQHAYAKTAYQYADAMLEARAK